MQSTKKVKKITSGTKEWADTNVNFAAGCTHDCRYCYAKGMAIRFQRCVPDNFTDGMDPEYADFMKFWFTTWRHMVVDNDKVDKVYAKRKGRIMLPSSHDLVPEYLEETLDVLAKLMLSGNSVLITTKPHMEVIKRICDSFQKYKEQIQFRFTITSLNDATLSYWEPGAPLITERIQALIYAFNAGYKTSLSIEPCLDEDPRDLVSLLEPFVTESIWIGIMNHNGEHVFNNVKTIENWLKWFKGHKLIRFKDAVYNKFNKISNYVPRNIKVDE